MINQDSLFSAMIDAMKTHSDAMKNISGAKNSISWNSGRVRCFLFDGLWFPLRTTVNYARQLQGITNDTNPCERDLEKLLSPLKPFLKDVELVINKLTKATFADQLEGRKRKWEAIHSLNTKQQLIQQWV